MIHNPCSIIDLKYIYMKDKNDGYGWRCKTNYPKQFQKETIVLEDRYPFYATKSWSKSLIWIDKISMWNWYEDRQLLSRSLYLFLLQKYEAHINMEVCNSIKAIEYIQKYIFKGNDRITIKLQNENDKVARHLNGCYIGLT